MQKFSYQSLDWWKNCWLQLKRYKDNPAKQNLKIIPVSICMICLVGCLTTHKVRPPRPILKSQYSLIVKDDWYLPPQSAKRLGEYIHQLEDLIDD